MKVRIYDLKEKKIQNKKHKPGQNIPLTQKPGVKPCLRA